MEEKKLNNDTEMNVGMLEDALIDTLKEVTIKFSKDSYICRILTDTIHLINRQKEEIERLTEEKQDLIGRKAGLEYSYNQVKEKNTELQKQVDELKDERENMQAEILRFEDMKFTQEHCDLYSENETLKQWLKRLNADLENEKNWGKIQIKQAVKDAVKKFADLVEFHSVATMEDNSEYFTISASGLKEILIENFDVGME